MPSFNTFCFAFRAFGGCSELSKMFLSTCLTTVYTLKPTGTPYGLDWTWFCELELNFWKTFNNVDFFETRFSQRKRGRVKVVLFTIWLLKMFWTEITNFSLVLLWELNFVKNGEMRRTLPNLEFKWFGLWYVDVYTTALICDLCIYLVEVLKRICFVLTYNLENGKMIRTCRN